ncbi:MAG: CvpA family protein [Oscillospiraceae bacterium]|nr:CvpA family protein [Oscillospiraceae bacterium]
MSAWIIDLLLVLAFLLVVLAAARRGFFKTVLRLAAWILSIALAGFLSAALAPPAYEAFAAAPARALIEQQIGAAIDKSQIAQTAQSVIEELPEAVRQLADYAGVPTESLIGNLKSNFSAANAAALLEQSVVAPIAISVIRLIICLLLFLLLLIALRFVGSKLEKLREVPVFKQTDWMLGAALGLVKGVLLVFVAALLLRAAAAIAADGPFALAVENSRIANLTSGLIWYR